MGRYTSAAFPFGTNVGLVLGAKSDEDVISTSIRNIILTPVGRQPYDPNVGSFIPLLVFEPNNVITQQLIRYYTAKALAEQEPRINVLAVFVASTDEHSITVRVAYSILSDPTARRQSISIQLPNGT